MFPISSRRTEVVNRQQIYCSLHTVGPTVNSGLKIKVSLKKREKRGWGKKINKEKSVLCLCICLARPFLHSFNLLLSHVCMCARNPCVLIPVHIDEEFCVHEARGYL